MGEYYLRYAHFCSTSLRFSALVININSRKLALSPIIGRITTILFSHFVEYRYHCYLETLIYFYGWILVEMCSFVFTITQMHCLGNHRIVQSWIYLHKYKELPHFFLPYCRVLISLYQRAFDIFVWVNISWYGLICISIYSETVSWSSWISINVSLAP